MSAAKFTIAVWHPNINAAMRFANTYGMDGLITLMPDSAVLYALWGVYRLDRNAYEFARELPGIVYMDGTS